MHRTVVVPTSLLVLACALAMAGCTVGATHPGYTAEVASPSIATTAPVDPVCFTNCAKTIERMEAEEAAQLAAIEAEKKAEEEAAARAAASSSSSNASSRPSVFDAAAEREAHRDAWREEAGVTIYATKHCSACGTNYSTISPNEVMPSTCWTCGIPW